MPRLKSSRDANGTVYYPITIAKGVYDTDRNQRMSQTLSDLFTTIGDINTVLDAINGEVI